MTHGDLVLVPHGGERIGQVLARVEYVSGAIATLRPWSHASRAWGKPRQYYTYLCTPAPETDRRVKAARKATP